MEFLKWVGIVVSAAILGLFLGTVAVALYKPEALQDDIPAAIVAPKPAGVTAGTYQVGIDIRPGRYKTQGAPPGSVTDICYWGRLKNDSGEFSAVIANELFQGNGVLTTKRGEFLKLTGDCVWQRVTKP
jgi:hypothetical protein